MDSFVYRGESQVFWFLLWALVIREFKGWYRRSLLGPAWAVIHPLMYMAVFTGVQGILNIPSEGTPYALFTYSGLVPWMLFSNTVIRCGPCIYRNAGIVKKIAVRREVFPAAEVLRSLVDFFLASLGLIGLMLWFGVQAGWSLLWLPFLLLLVALLSMGIGLAVAALGTYRFDTIFVLPFLMQFWLLATPVMYPLGSVPDRWRFLYSLNPMVGIVEGFRLTLLKGVSPDLGLLALSMLGTGVVWLLAWPLFLFMSQYFADVL